MKFLFSTDGKEHSKLTASECSLKILICIVLIAQNNHYGKSTSLHQLILSQLTNQIMQQFPTKSCGVKAKEVADRF